MLRTLIVTASVFLLISPASSQPRNEVLENYRAYQAALERRDIPAAEAAAENALAASEARDGDGGQTAILALNLAITRLTLGDNPGALAAAQRAFALAEAGARGVEPTFAELILGRAELAAGVVGGADRLERVLTSEHAAATLAPDELYMAASQLGTWAVRESQFARARSAWATAARFASGAPLGAAYSLAGARIGEATSIILDEWQRVGERMDIERAHEAYSLLDEAAALLSPLSNIESHDRELTLAQSALAQTMAWRAVLRAKLRTDQQELPPDWGEAEGDGDAAEIGPRDLTRIRCPFRLVARPRPVFPRSSQQRLQVGSVVIRLTIDDAGTITGWNTAAHVGDVRFVEAVESVVGYWRIERRSDAVSYCRMGGTVLQPIAFSFR